MPGHLVVVGNQATKCQTVAPGGNHRPSVQDDALFIFRRASTMIRPRQLDNFGFDLQLFTIDVFCSITAVTDTDVSIERVNLALPARAMLLLGHIEAWPS